MGKTRGNYVRNQVEEKKQYDFPAVSLYNGRSDRDVDRLGNAIVHVNKNVRNTYRDRRL